jgi:hypothetical protein
MSEFIRVTTADAQHEIYLNLFAIAYVKFHKGKTTESAHRRGTVYLFGGEHGYFNVQGESADALEAAIARLQISAEPIGDEP